MIALTVPLHPVLASVATIGYVPAVLPVNTPVDGDCGTPLKL